MKKTSILFVLLIFIIFVYFVTFVGPVFYKAFFEAPFRKDKLMKRVDASNYVLSAMGYEPIGQTTQAISIELKNQKGEKIKTITAISSKWIDGRWIGEKVSLSKPNDEFQYFEKAILDIPESSHDFESHSNNGSVLIYKSLLEEDLASISVEER